MISFLPSIGVQRGCHCPNFLVLCSNDKILFYYTFCSMSGWGWKSKDNFSIIESTYIIPMDGDTSLLTYLNSTSILKLRTGLDTLLHNLIYIFLIKHPEFNQFYDKFKLISVLDFVMLFSFIKYYNL